MDCIFPKGTHAVQVLTVFLFALDHIKELMVLAGDTSRTHSSLNTLTDLLTPFHVRHQSFAKLLLVQLVLLLHSLLLLHWVLLLHCILLRILLLLNCGVILFSSVTTFGIVATLGIGTTFDV